METAARITLEICTKALKQGISSENSYRDFPRSSSWNCFSLQGLFLGFLNNKKKNSPRNPQRILIDNHSETFPGIFEGISNGILEEIPSDIPPEIR